MNSPKISWQFRNGVMRHQRKLINSTKVFALITASASVAQMLARIAPAPRNWNFVVKLRYP
jgi:hypothetical protein